MNQPVHGERRVQRVRHEIRFREIEVARVHHVGDEFIRVIFSGDQLQGFVSLGFDDHVKFICPDPSADTDAEPTRRDYTPRHWDPQRAELTIDFALHGEGVASNWAQQAAPGQKVSIGGPRGSMIVPMEFDWHLLVGDATAAPAIGRRLAELPASAHAIVIVQLANIEILELSKSMANVALRQANSGSELLSAVRQMYPSHGFGYAWGAGEAAMMLKLRDLLLIEKNHPRHAMRIAAYWKLGAKEFHHEELTPPDDN